MQHRKPIEKNAEELKSQNSSQINGSKTEQAAKSSPELTSEQSWILDELALATLKKRLKKMLNQ